MNVLWYFDELGQYWGDPWIQPRGTSAVSGILSRHTSDKMCSLLWDKRNWFDLMGTGLISSLSFGGGGVGGWVLNEVRLFQKKWCGKKYGWKRPKLLCSVSTSKSVTTPTQLLNTSQTLRRCDLNSNPTALQCECMQGGRLPACTLQSGQGSDCACDAGGPAPCKLFCFEMQFKQKLMDGNLSQALYLYLNLFFSSVFSSDSLLKQELYTSPFCSIVRGQR